MFDFESVWTESRDAEIAPSCAMSCQAIMMPKRNNIETKVAR